jgi:outer membrane protein assembly factor BamB
VGDGDQNGTVDDGDQNETIEEEIEKVDTPIRPEYTSFPIENGAHALTNNGRYLVYGTINGLIYSLDVETGNSEFLFDLNDDIPNILIGGLAYIGDNEYYYGAAHNSTIRQLNIVTGASHILADSIFPDGIDYFNGYIYSVTNNMDDRLTVFDTDGNIVTRISTGIEDFVAITHSDRYLYILSEEGDIYQVDPDTGDSHMVVNNTEFEGGDSFGGVEGLDLLDHHLYMTNVNDSTIYRVEIDVRAFE